METKPQIDQEIELGMAEDRFLVFTIDEQDYAMEIRYIIETIEMAPITRVPFLPSCIKGIINLRGSVIPVMDVRLRFGLPAQEYTERTCIIVLDNEGVQLGLIVDMVQEVATIPEDRRMPPPSTQAGLGDSIRYIKGMGNVGGEIQLLLDCNKLMEIQE